MQLSAHPFTAAAPSLFLEAASSRECVFCSGEGKDFYERADLKYYLQHCLLLISSSNLQTC